MHRQSGFTLVEVTIISGILAVLFSITSLSISNTVPKSSLDTATQLLVANIKQQQISALTSATEGQSSSGNFGIHFGVGKYTLFKGNVYNLSDTSNYDIPYSDINFTSSTPGSSIIFQKTSGVIQNVTVPGATITLTQINISKSTTITINKYGIIESIL